MLVGAVDCNGVILAHQGVAVNQGELGGNLCRNESLDDDFAVIVGSDICTVHISGIAFELHGEAVSSAQLCKLVNEAKATAYNRVGNVVLCGNTNTDSAFCSSNTSGESFIHLLGSQCAGIVVIGRSICPDCAFRSTGNTRVKTNDRDTCSLSGGNSIQAGLSGQSCKTDSCGLSSNSRVQLGQLLIISRFIGGANKVDGDTELGCLLFRALQNCLPVLMLEALGDDFEMQIICKCGDRHTENQHECQNNGQCFFHGESS